MGVCSLVKKCDIFFRENGVGTAEIEKKGLYYRFRCRCNLPEGKMYRLWADCDKGKVNLGICVPQEGEFILCTQIPITHIGEGSINMFVLEKDDASEDRTFPVSEENPFGCLEKLDNAYLHTSNEEVQILIKG